MTEMTNSNKSTPKFCGAYLIIPPPQKRERITWWYVCLMEAQVNEKAFQMRLISKIWKRKVYIHTYIYLLSNDSMNLREVGKCGIFKFCFQMKPRLLQDTWSCDQIIFLYLQLGLIFFSMYLNFISYISHTSVHLIICLVLFFWKWDPGGFFKVHYI
jgi:hypothetical protein